MIFLSIAAVAALYILIVSSMLTQRPQRRGPRQFTKSHWWKA